MQSEVSQRRAEVVMVEPKRLRAVIPFQKKPRCEVSRVALHLFTLSSKNLVFVRRHGNQTGHSGSLMGLLKAASLSPSYARFLPQIPRLQSTLSSMQLPLRRKQEEEENQEKIVRDPVGQQAVQTTVQTSLKRPRSAQCR